MNAFNDRSDFDYETESDGWLFAGGDGEPLGS